MNSLFDEAGGSDDLFTQQETAAHSGFYSSLKELLLDDIPEDEEIIFGAGRGDVVQLVSVTDAGKTTLTLNTCLRLASGENCIPLAPDVPFPRRVLYADFEATRGKLKQYLNRMRSNFSPDAWRLAEQNFIPFADPIVQNEPLCLSNSMHFRLIRDKARKANVDLIVIDTVSAAFELTDENSNAEVRSAIMRPLKRLAQETNSAVLFCHHAGKPNKSPFNELAYIGRGASTFGALSRAVFSLSKAKTKGPDYIILRCAKAKRPKFDDILLKLNRDRAWFEICAEKPELPQAFTVQEIVEFIDLKGEARRKDVLDHFKGRAPEETIDNRLRDAAKAGLIDNPKRGLYRSKSPSSPVN